MSSSLGLFSPLCSPATTSVPAWDREAPKAEGNRAPNEGEDHQKARSSRLVHRASGPWGARVFGSSPRGRTIADRDQFTLPFRGRAFRPAHGRWIDHRGGRTARVRLLGHSSRLTPVPGPRRLGGRSDNRHGRRHHATGARPDSGRSDERRGLAPDPSGRGRFRLAQRWSHGSVLAAPRRVRDLFPK